MHVCLYFYLFIVLHNVRGEGSRSTRAAKKLEERERVASRWAFKTTYWVHVKVGHRVSQRDYMMPPFEARPY